MGQGHIGQIDLCICRTQRNSQREFLVIFIIGEACAFYIVERVMDDLNASSRKEFAVFTGKFQFSGLLDGGEDRVVRLLDKNTGRLPFLFNSQGFIADR